MRSASDPWWALSTVSPYAQSVMQTSPSFTMVKRFFMVLRSAPATISSFFLLGN